MNPYSWSLVLVGLLCAGQYSSAEAPASNWADYSIPPETKAEDWDSGRVPSSNSSMHRLDKAAWTNSLDDGDSELAYGDENGEAKAGPSHIRDNGFFVEEAFNQEPGDVQHIFNWVNAWDRSPQGHTRDFSFTYTMELPLGSQAHQFSFTTLFLDGFEHPNDATPVQQGGVGDTFLNYRYQLLSDDEFLWCAPRFSLIVPTGDERFGLGNGEVGYQTNLPISRYGDRFDFHFNAGYTITPDVNAQLPPAFPLIEHDLRGYNLGGSVFWKPKVNLHFFLESLALCIDEIDDVGSRTNVNQVFLNPGVRYAVCQFDEVEWVIGGSVPVGLTPDTPDVGMFVYMSVEHTFRKVSE